MIPPLTASRPASPLSTGLTDLELTDIKTSTPRRHRPGLTAFIIVLSLLLALGAAAFCLGRFYFDGRAPLGTSFAGQPVAGKTAGQLTDLVTSKVNGTVFTLTSPDGTTVQAHYQDLGVKVDVKQTVNSLLTARGSNPFMRVNPFNGPQLGLVASFDRASLQQYLLDSLVPVSARVVLPKVTFNQVNGSFTVIPGRAGKEVSAVSTQRAVTASFSQPADTVKVDVPLVEKDSPISAQAAQAAADQANQGLHRQLVVSNGETRSFTVPAAQIAQWTKVSADPDAGTMSVSYDKDGLAKYLQTTLPTQLAQKRVDEKVLVTPTGERLLVQTAGADGVVVKDMSAAIAQVGDALAKGSDATATVTTAVDKFQVVKVPVPSKFDVPNGDPHVVVDLSKQKVSVYRGTTLVKSYLMASGRQGWATGDGTFYVYAKYRKQTMKTADPKGPVKSCEGIKGPWLYCDDGDLSQPGHGAQVEWISYFDHRGIAFHSAPWNLVDIGRGMPSSHGCINMSPADAQWMFNFLSVGTQVKVVGNTPTQPVR